MNHLTPQQVVFIDRSDTEYKNLVRDMAGCLRRQEVIPFLGAGISFETPSRLPMAKQFVEPLVDVLWRSGENAFREIQASRSEMNNLESVLREARMERLLDALCQLHGERALDYLSPLASECWNPIHGAIAAICKEGLIRWCITLNFDLLLESAAHAHGITSQTICPILDRSFPGGSGAPSLTIVKPHGSFVPADSQYRKYELLSATLSQVGSRPSRNNIEVFKEALYDFPVLLVAGYSDNDWDIFPILQRNSWMIQRIVWIDFANEDSVRQRVNPLGGDEPHNALRDRVYPWLCKTGGHSCLLVGRAKDYFVDLLRELDIAQIECPKPSVLAPSPDVSMFHGDRDGESLKTVGSLALIVQQTNHLSEKLLRWLRDRLPTTGETDMRGTVEDALGHTYHTYGDLEMAIQHTKRAISLKSQSGPRAQTAGMVVWLGYEYLCLAKRPHPVKVWRLLGWVYFLLKGLWLLRRGVTLASPMERSRQSALAAYYRADLLHSWGSLFLLLGPLGRRVCRPLFRIISRIYDKIAAESDLMDGEYYWLRHLEARLLAGAPVDRRETEKTLDEIERAYQMVQNNVQIGNTYAYRGLMVYILGLDTYTARQQEAEHWFEKAAQAWESAARGVSSGSRRLCIFRRFVGLTGLGETIRSFLKLS